MAEAPCLWAYQAQQPVDTVTALDIPELDSVIFGVGCYELIELEKRRIGSIQFGLVSHQRLSQNEGRTNIKIFPPYLLEWGLLDLVLKYESADKIYAFGVGSDASFHGFHLTCDLSKVHINDTVRLSHSNSPDQGVIGLALDVLAERNRESVVAWSCSDGTICLAKPLSETDSVISSWQGHKAEAWSVALDPHSHGCFLASGDDDGVLKIWDSRDHRTPAAINSKTHLAGVTVVAYDPILETTLFTGSYDDHFRVWDSRMLNAPTIEQNVCGGVWRVKFDNWGTSNARLLIAATHGGCKIYAASCQNSDYRFNLETSHHSHESMAYGITSLGQHFTDPQTSNKEFPHSFKRKIGSTLYMSGSFYDKRVAFWEA